MLIWIKCESIISPNNTPANFTSSNKTKTILEKGVKYVQSEQKHQNNVIDVRLVFLLLTLNIFQIFF